MAHEISVLTDGTVEAMYANRPAWHGLGTIFDQDGQSAPDSATAMELAHLDWQVELCPVQTSDGLEIPGYYATRRDDTKAPLGIVGDRYAVWQNRDAFNFLDSFVEDGIIRYESAMALKGGKTIVLLARMPSVDVAAEGDNLLRYILCSTAHDGTGAVVLQPTSVRVVCANTLRLAVSDRQQQVSIRHTGDMGYKLAIAREYLSQFDAAFDRYSENVKHLVSRKYTADEATAYINQLYPLPPTDAHSRSKTLRANRVQAVRDAFRHPSNQLPAVKGTWWQLVNAVTYTVDHNATSRGANPQIKAENHFASVIDGNGADFKDKAFALAMTMAA
jgi:phage/plasmid-like protein (TIGR03299 family)